MGNAIIRGSDNRSVVNTSIVRMNSGDGKAVASVSKGFALSMTSNTALSMSCVKCGTIAMGTRPALHVRLARSSRLVSRMMIANCVSRGGTDLANSITIIGVGSMTSVPAKGILSDLRKHITNVGVAASNAPNNKGASALIHNGSSFQGSTGSPLCIVSNIVAHRGVSSVLSSGSMRSVRMLGSTTSTSVCNTRTTGNIVVVAAGHTGGKRAHISFSVSLALRACRYNLSVLGTSR